MGMFDIVHVPCPACGTKMDCQSKGGNCRLSEYELGNCPQDVLGDVNRHAPFTCVCGVKFTVNLTGTPIRVAEQ